MPMPMQMMDAPTCKHEEGAQEIKVQAAGAMEKHFTYNTRDYV